MARPHTTNSTKLPPPPEVLARRRHSRRCQHKCLMRYKVKSTSRLFQVSIRSISEKNTLRPPLRKRKSRREATYCVRIFISNGDARMQTSLNVFFLTCSFLGRKHMKGLDAPKKLTIICVFKDVRVLLLNSLLR